MRTTEAAPLNRAAFFYAMSRTAPIYFETTVGQGRTVLARVENDQGLLVTRSNLSEIIYTVTAQRGGEIIAPEVVPLSVISDTPIYPEDDPRWGRAFNVEGVPRNFEHAVPAAAFPAQDWYWIEYRFELANGGFFSHMLNGPARSALVPVLTP